MSFPNVSDILATTIENRSRKISDNVTKHNAFYKRLKQKGRTKTVSGGHKIYQELSFAENGNRGYYSGYDALPVAAQEVISAAEYTIKQAAVPVVISGLEQLWNSGREQMIDLMSSRMAIAEASMMNLLADGVYSDGTGYGGKEIEGLDKAVVVDPTASTSYGGINQATWTFWRNKTVDTTGINSSTIQGSWNGLWAQLQRGSDRPDIILCDSTTWQHYVASLQAVQRFTSASEGNLGFPSLKFFDTDVVLDGGIGGFCPAGTAFFLNCDYLHYRPHARRNMVPLSPNRRYATNQDAEVQILAWAGNITCCGRQFQGRWDNN